MGLSGPKSLLQVKPGASFLDVLARQVLALREWHGARLPLVLMNYQLGRPSSAATARASSSTMPCGLNSASTSRVARRES